MAKSKSSSASLKVSFGKRRIGKAEKNNGALILVSLDEKKMSIQTGYGLEGVLPDAICKRIIENEIKPSFKSGLCQK